MFNKKNLLLMGLVFIFMALQSVSALTANSSSYSVSMFGTGMASSNQSSANYTSVSISEAKATTRNAESSSLTANIGFFENTIYHRTVSITSWLISPPSKSAVIGSTIGLYISALNYQFIWAEITSPNNQLQILTLNNTNFVYYLPSPSVIGRYKVIFYANSSTGATASAVDYFNLTEQIAPPVTPPPGGGGGTTTIIEKCVYYWDCTPWTLCSEGKNTRECANTGTCVGTEGKPKEEINCSEQLFDILIKQLIARPLNQNRTIEFRVDLIDKVGIEKFDVHIKYSIIDSNNTEIFSRIETKAILGNLSFEKILDEIELADGEYDLRVDILYGNLQRAFAEQKFKVGNGKIEIKEPAGARITLIKLLILILLIIVLFVIVLIILIKRRGKIDALVTEGKEYMQKGEISKAKENYKLLKDLYESKYKGKASVYNKIKDYYDVLANSMKNKSAFFAVSILTLFLIGFVVNSNITGFAVNDLASPSKAGGIWIMLIGILALSLLIWWKRTSKIIKKSEQEDYTSGLNKFSSFREKSISGLLNKKVYSENGRYLGEINDVILANNRIDSLKIKLDKKDRFKARGVIASYKYVRGIGEVIIIDEKIAEHLETVPRSISLSAALIGLLKKIRRQK